MPFSRRAGQGADHVALAVTLIRKLRRYLLDRRGTVAIEFAAIALPLMLLLGGSIEISRYTWTRIALQDSASVGARCLGLRVAPCVADDTVDREATVALVKQQAMGWGIAIPEGAVMPEADVACENVAGFAKVRIRHRFTSVLAVLPETGIDVEACFPILPAQ